jgi:plastocyanin
VYQWWIFLHLLGAFGFLVSHGVSVAVAFRIRNERDPKRVQALLGMSSASISAFYPSMAALLAGGVAGAFTADLWGYGWIWASIVLLVVVTAAMYAMARPAFRRLRFVTDALVDGSEAVTPEEYYSALKAPRQMAVAWIGFVGLFLILYLMVFKPSLGMSPEGEAAPPEGPAAASLSATELAFDTERLTVPANRRFGLTLDNQSAASHNVSISDDAGRTRFSGQIFAGPEKLTYGVPALEAGEYRFVCDVHPQQMTGTLVAE